jgi:hypothetical protein
MQCITPLSPTPLPPSPQLLDGLLQPLPEDRLTASEAMDLLEGRRRFSRAARPAQRQQQQQAITLPDGTMVPISTQALNPTAPMRKPKGSRVELTSVPGKLNIEIPAKGLTGSTLATGSFAVVWNAFVAVWTAGAIASGGILFALFSLPFWFAGGQLVTQTLLPALLRENLELGRNRFRLSRDLAVLKDGVANFVSGGKTAEPIVGLMSDLRAARVVTVMIVNGEPKTAIELVEGVDVHRFGEGLTTVEQQWLVQEINARVADVAGGQVDMEALPAPKAPKVVTSTDSDDDE